MANFSFGNKDLSKRDINFFDEFTASARKTAQILLIAVLIGAVLVGASVIWLVVDIFRNNGIKNEISDIETELQKPEYANLELTSHQLEQEINDKNKYYFALSEMKRTLVETIPADTKILDMIEKNIPNEAYVSAYDLSGNELTIAGYTFDYYSASEILHLFQKDQETFTPAPADVKVETVEKVDVGGNGTSAEMEILNAIDRYYTFEIAGLIGDGNIYISYSSYIKSPETVTPLGAVETVAVKAGDTYTIKDVTSVERNGQTYQLESVMVDGVSISEEQLSTVIAVNELNISSKANTEVKLYYSVVEESAEEEAAE